MEAPFEIADHFCSIMKKSPMHSYAKRTGKMPMTAQMASESRLRTTNWLKNGCNGFDMKSPISNPMSFWTEQDVLEYIFNSHIPIADVYGEVTADFGEAQPQGNTMDMGIFDVGKTIFDTNGVAALLCCPIIILVACHRINRYNDMRTEKGKGSRTPVFHDHRVLEPP